MGENICHSGVNCGKLMKFMFVPGGGSSVMTFEELLEQQLKLDEVGVLCFKLKLLLAV